jgi:hypothetical protein
VGAGIAGIRPECFEGKHLDVEEAIRRGGGITGSEMRGVLWVERRVQRLPNLRIAHLVPRLNRTEPGHHAKTVTVPDDVSESPGLPRSYGRIRHPALSYA